MEKRIEDTSKVQSMVEIGLLRRIEQLAYNIVEGEGKIAEARKALKTAIPRRVVLTEVELAAGEEQYHYLEKRICNQLTFYTECANGFSTDIDPRVKQQTALLMLQNMQKNTPEFPGFIAREDLVDLFQYVLMHAELRRKIEEAHKNGDSSLSIEVAVLNQPMPEAQSNLMYDQFLLKDQLSQLLTHREPALQNRPLALQEQVRERYSRLVQEEIPQKYHLNYVMQARLDHGFN